MGVVGGIPATARNVAAMADNAPPGSHWGVIGISRAQWLVVAAALTLGGSIRVGLEDNFYLPDGTMARSNGDLVAKARAMTQDVGRTPGHGRAGARAARACRSPPRADAAEPPRHRRTPHALRRAAAHRPAVPRRRAGQARRRRAGAAGRARPAHGRRPAARGRARALALRAQRVRRPGDEDLADRRAAAPGEPAQRRARRLQPLGLRDPRRDDRRDRRRARRAAGAAGADPLHRRQGPHRPGGRADPQLARRVRRDDRRRLRAQRRAPARRRRRGDRQAGGGARRQRARAARPARGAAGVDRRRARARCAASTAAPGAYLLAHGARPEDLRRLRAALVAS